MGWNFNVTRWEIRESKTFTLTFGGADADGNVLRCNDKSVVLAQIHELSSDKKSPFIGATSMSIDNVAPGDNAVTVRGSIGADTDRLARITFFVVM
ncbi:hypothetical protein [Streptomyces sp. NPDC056512]|uniref:hypothetical protein n=1 Tax=Streptomyces sp. NPDC056512 TaxID=3345846 RepID=UPI00369CFFF0